MPKDAFQEGSVSLRVICCINAFDDFHSGICDRIFGEDLLDPPKRLLRGRFRRSPVLHNVCPGRRPDMLVLNLGIGRIERPVIRNGRAEQRLGRVSFSMRVGEPPWIALATDGMHGTLRPSPTFRYSLQTFGWIRYLRNSFATATFLAPFGIRPQVVRAWLGTGLPAFETAAPSSRPP